MNARSHSAQEAGIGGAAHSLLAVGVVGARVAAGAVDGGARLAGAGEAPEAPDGAKQPVRVKAVDFHQNTPVERDGAGRRCGGCDAEQPEQSEEFHLGPDRRRC